MLMKSPSSNVREVTRTPDLPLRRRSLYPTELHRHIRFFGLFTGFFAPREPPREVRIFVRLSLSRSPCLPPFWGKVSVAFFATPTPSGHLAKMTFQIWRMAPFSLRSGRSILLSYGNIFNCKPYFQRTMCIIPVSAMFCKT